MVLDAATPASFKEMLRVIKYVLDTKEYGLRVHPTKAKDEFWELVCFCDSNCTGDPDTRRSVTGCVLYLHEGSSYVLEIKVSQCYTIKYVLKSSGSLY